MNSFTYCNSTKLVFGQGAEAGIGAEAALWAGKSAAVLLVSGGSSARRSGLLARVRASLEAAGLAVTEAAGVQPNPTMDFVREAAKAARAAGVCAVVAVGGGSVIDTAKGVALACCYEGDPWDFFCGKASPRAALPVLAVLTLPAAGSEQSIRCVITDKGYKLGLGNGLLRPKAAFINPELFLTLPPRQVANGVVDMMSHIMERYFTNTDGVEFTSGQAEAAMRTIMSEGLKLARDAHDTAAWSEVALAGSFAHNGYFGLGHVEDWACHGIEHALSGWEPSIAHGTGLAVIIPGWLAYTWKANPARAMRFAVEVMGAAPGSDAAAVVADGVARYRAFARAMGMPSHLAELTDRPIPLDEIARKAAGKAPLGNFMKLAPSDVKAILESVL